MSDPKKFIFRECKPLDWGNCGSKVVGVVSKPTIRRSKYPKKKPEAERKWELKWDGAEAVLTDCSRSISWEFMLDRYINGRGGPNVEKAKELLDFAQGFYNGMVKARTEYDKLQAAVKRRNEEEGLKDEDDDE